MERTDPSERRDNGLNGKAHVRFCLCRGQRQDICFPLIATVKAVASLVLCRLKDITTLNFNVRYYPQKRKLHDPGNGAG